MLEEGSSDETGGRKPGRPPLDESPEGLLKAEPRKRLLRLIRKKPGIRMADLMIEADMSTGSFYYHLDHLKKVKLVETVTAAGVARAFPAGQVVDVPAAPLDSEATRLVARMVLRKPGVSSEEIAGVLEQTPRAVLKHLGALMEAGLVERVSEGRAKHYHPTAALRDAFQRK